MFKKFGLLLVLVLVVACFLTGKGGYVYADGYPVTSSGAGAYYAVDESDWYPWPSQETDDTYKSWKIKFNKTINEATINSNTVYITDEAFNRIPIRHEINGTELDVIPGPGVEYTPGETYTLWIKDLQAKDGSLLNKNVKMEFTILEPPATELEVIITQQPGSTTATARVYLHNPEGMATGNLDATYDADRFILQAVSKGALPDSFEANINDPGIIKAGWFNLQGINISGIVFEATFSVSGGQALELNLQDIKLTTIDGKPIPFRVRGQN